MVRRFLAAGATLVAGASLATAADLPHRSAPIAPAPYYAPAPAFSWTGFYVGATAGADFRSATATSVVARGFTAPAPGTAYQGSAGGSVGFTGGVHAGYNWQVQNGFVLGLEGDLDYVGHRSMRGPVLPGAPGTPYFAYTNPVSGGSEWIGTIRPRAGVAIDRALLYVTGGVAFGSVPGGGSVRYTTAVPATFVYTSTSSSTTKVGWALGAGAEYAITPNLIGRVEYLYTSFGSKSVAYAAPAGAPVGSVFTASYKSNVGLLRAGLSYKF